MSDSRREAALLGLLVPVSLLSHLTAAVPRGAYYFRDFGMGFYPFHSFWAGELAAGRWPLWNPYIQEGVFAFPMCYPLDLLHALWPGPAAVSWLLTLHFPIAALCAYGLARELGISRRGAFVAGATYALGGLAVASLNLYVFLQALALAPLVALLLHRAAQRGGRAIPMAALALGVALTTAQEFVIQAVVLGLALGLASAKPTLRILGRVGLAIGLGGALAAVPLALVLGILPETVRGLGLPQAVAMDYSLHPAVLLQAVLRDVFGSLEFPVELWWGHRFFTNGFPYFISLYVGPQALAVALAGLRGWDRRRLVVLLVLGGIGLWYALGPWGGLAPALSSWPFFRSFRYPSKALLLPYLVLVLLVGKGFERLGRGEGWRPYRAGALAAATFALCLAALAALAPEAIGEWMESDPVGNPLLGAALAREGLMSATVALLGVVSAVAFERRRLVPRTAASLVGVVLILDLARSGAGVNPQTSPAFYRLLPELAALHLDDLGGQRVFSYLTEQSPVFNQYVGQHEPGTVLAGSFVKRQMLLPYTNLIDRIETGPIEDMGAFLFLPPPLDSWGFHPSRVSTILSRLRDSAVGRILSLDALDHPDLTLRAAVPAGPRGLMIHVYEIARPWPRAFVACRVLDAAGRTEALRAPLAEGYDPGRDVALEEPATAACTGGSVQRGPMLPARQTYAVESDGPGYLVTRDSFARGWKATVDGKPVRVLRANGKQRAVAIPAGRHSVLLFYEPPGLKTGLAAMATGLLVTLALWVRPLLGGPAVDG